MHKRISPPVRGLRVSVGRTNCAAASWSAPVPGTAISSHPGAQQKPHARRRTHAAAPGTGALRPNRAAEPRRFFQTGSWLREQRQMSTVAVRLFHRERVGQMPNFSKLAVVQRHLHDGETNFHLRIFQQPQIVQRDLGKQPLGQPSSFGKGRKRKNFTVAAQRGDRSGAAIIPRQRQCRSQHLRCRLRCREDQSIPLHQPPICIPHHRSCPRRR